MTLRGILADVHRCPLVVRALTVEIQELNLIEALGIVFIGSTLAEVVTVVVHELISTILAANDGFQHCKGIGILMTLHQGTGKETCCGTTGGTTLGPLTASITAGQQSHGLSEVFLHLIHHTVVLCERVLVTFSEVGGVESVEG